MDHTVLPANNTMPDFPSWRSPDVTTTATDAADIQLQLTTHFYRPRKDERLSWPSWLTYSGWLTHISGHPSATSRAQDSESTSAKDQCSTGGPRNQLNKQLKRLNRSQEENIPSSVKSESEIGKSRYATVRPGWPTLLNSRSVKCC